MANLIDASYFIGEIEIPNLNQEAVATDLLHSITLYEKEVLTDLLGYAMYKDLKAAMLVDPLEDKWDKLINGEEFSYTPSGSAEVVAKWEGLKGLDKKSLVAYYIYFEHRNKRSSYNAGVGIEVEAATDNSKPSSLYVKLTEVWNDFINMYGNTECNYSASSELVASIYPTGYNYPPHSYPADYNDPLSYHSELPPIAYPYTSYPYVNYVAQPASAFNYLLSKQADFPNWKFKSLGGELNRFGL